MQHFKSLLFVLYNITSLIVLTFFISLFYFVPYKRRNKLLFIWAKSCLWMLEKLCGLKVEIVGLENIPDKPCLVFSKHQSTLETIVLQTIFYPQIWVVKRELLWIPFFGWSLKMSRAIAIDRSSGKKALNQIVSLGTQSLKEGFWTIIFPEGTRSKPGERTEYKVGGAILASKSGFDIVPVTHNFGLFWPKGQFYKKAGVAKLVIGPVIKNKNKKTKQLLSESEEWIESTYLSL